MSELPVKYKPKLKSTTLKGAKISHFTLLVNYYPNKKYKNPKFTYRGDLMMRELNSIFNNKFKNQLEALKYKAEIVKNNAFEMVIFDNSFPTPYSLIKKWYEGNVILDSTNEYHKTKTGDLVRKISIPNEK